MSLYRCAICGSPRLVKMNEKSGFSYGKAAVGTAVFGVVGAVAGLDGKNTDVYKCPDCGHTMSEPMDFNTQNAIDMCVRDVAFRHEYNWESLKRKYINIESGYGDKQAAEAVSGLQAAVQSVIDEVNKEYEYCKTLTEQELASNERYVAAKKAPYDEKIEKEVTAKIEKAKAEYSDKRNAILTKNAELLEKTKKEIEQIKTELAQPSKSQKKQKTMKRITLFIFIFMMASVIVLNSTPIITDKSVNASVNGGLVTVCFFAIIIMLFRILKNTVKIRKEVTARKEKEESLPQKEKSIEDLEKKIGDIKNNPNTLYELRLPDAQSETRRLRRETDYPLIVSARLRLQDHEKLSLAQRDEVDRIIMTDIVLRIFRKYAGEIQLKKIKEIMTKTIPNGLIEDRFRRLSNQKISLFFDDVKPKLELRIERATNPGASDYDIISLGKYCWFYYSLKQ